MKNKKNICFEVMFLMHQADQLKDYILEQDG